MDKSLINENNSTFNILTLEERAKRFSERLEHTLSQIIEKEEYGKPRKNFSWGLPYNDRRYGFHYKWVMLTDNKECSTIMHPLYMCTEGEIIFVYLDNNGVEHLAYTEDEALERYIKTFPKIKYGLKSRIKSIKNLLL